MIDLSYNLSSNIKQDLDKIENLRAKILLTPLSLNTELKLKWSAIVNKIYWSLLLDGAIINKSEIIKTLSTVSQKETHAVNLQKEILGYKKALDYINYEWLVSSKKINSKTIINLHDLASNGTLKTTESSLKQILEYIQSGSEHPIIQMAIAHIAILNLNGFSAGNGKISRLTTYLFLSKYGYDFRGLLCLDEYLKRDIVSYESNIKAVSDGGSLTLWIEYFTKGIIVQLEKALTDILSEKYSPDLKKDFFELNDRQKEILSILGQPGTNISNKKVQKMFKVSQITASRDLSKLGALGLLFIHGKGRSVYYTKI